MGDSGKGEPKGRAPRKGEAAGSKRQRASAKAVSAAAKRKRAAIAAERDAARKTRAPRTMPLPLMADLAASGRVDAAATDSERAAALKERIERKLGFPPLDQHASVEDRLERLEQRLEALSDGLRELAYSIDGHARDLRRLLLVDREELPFPQRLTAGRGAIGSQTGEDGITIAILREVGIGPRRFVEIGVGANGGNTGFLARELGFSGLMVDAEQVCIDVIQQTFDRVLVTAVREWVTAENIDELLSKHRATGEIDVLSIDIDGNDVWVWEACTVCHPRLVIIEFNPSWGPERAVAVPYDPSFDRHRRMAIYFGASLAAVATIAERKGYRLVATTPGGPNAFLLRADVGGHIPAISALDGWTQMTHVLWKRLLRNGTPGDLVAELFAYVQAERLPLVEL